MFHAVYSCNNPSIGLSLLTVLTNTSIVTVALFVALSQTWKRFEQYYLLYWTVLCARTCTTWQTGPETECDQKARDNLPFAHPIQ